MTIYSDNEWGQLKRVIVGDATKANWPSTDKDFVKAMTDDSQWTETEFQFGPVKPEVIDRANESLENFTTVLEDLGTEVIRPLPRDYQEYNLFYGYCPRDTVLIVGDRVLACPTPYESRRTEWYSYMHVWQDHTVVTCDDPAAQFDAANVCRLGRDLLYLVSPSGNIEGARWLQDWLGKEYRVHPITNLYAGVHIDSTITPVREGLVVLNAGRINDDNLPEVFKSWDKIYIHAEELELQTFDHYPYASNWIGLNFLMYDEKTAIVDPKQKVLQEKLAAYGVESIGVDLTESRTLGGGHHCCTLDIHRL
jgi:N-dimethylarginine dimethylaminohydrolase